ncbi:MAG: RidA family protein [Magnetococcales bacterium]|nr:RidA family protein [Magnetococcales bacterium]
MPEAIASPEAPAAIGPYSQAVRCRGWVFVSGQIPLDPRTGELVAGGVDLQARQVLHNIAAILAAAGCGLDGVVKTTVYLVDLADFAAVNALYQEFFAAPYPARATVQVAALPRGARVEIDAIACPGEGV